MISNYIVQLIVLQSQSMYCYSTHDQCDASNYAVYANMYKWASAINQSKSGNVKSIKEHTNAESRVIKEKLEMIYKQKVGTCLSSEKMYHEELDLQGSKGAEEITGKAISGLNATNRS